MSEKIPSPQPMELACKGGPVELEVTHSKNLRDAEEDQDLWAVVCKNVDGSAYFTGVVSVGEDKPERGMRVVVTRAESEGGFMSIRKS